MIASTTAHGAQAQKKKFCPSAFTDELSFKNDNPKTFFKNVSLEDFVLLVDEQTTEPFTDHKIKRNVLFYACEHNKKAIVSHFLKECKKHKPDLLRLIDLPSTVSISHPSPEINTIYSGAISTETSLFIASKNGHSSIVEALLEHGANPNRAAKELVYASGGKNIVTVKREISPLGSACLQNHHAKVVEVLLKHGAATEYLNSSIFYDETGKKIRKTMTQTALHHACRNPSKIIEIVELLLKHHASLETTQRINLKETNRIETMSALSLSCDSRFIEATLCLLQNGANPEHGSATAAGDEAPVADFIPTNLTPLCYAVRLNYKAAVSALLLHKANINGTSTGTSHLPNRTESSYECIVTTPLIDACCFENSALVTELLDAGADINKYTTATKKNDDGTISTYEHTALIVCCLQSHTELVNLLLERGADTTLFEKAVTQEIAFFVMNSPLLIACENGMLSCVEKMLAKGAEIEWGTLAVNVIGEGRKKVYEEKTPLLMASEQNNKDLCALLLSHGANPNAHCLLSHEQYTYYMTPFQKACLHEEIPLLQVFLEPKNDKTHQSNVNTYCASLHNKTQLVQIRTPLCMAAGVSGYEVVKYLLAHDADMYLKDKKFFVDAQELTRRFELLNELVTDTTVIKTQPASCVALAKSTIISISPHKLASQLHDKKMISIMRLAHECDGSVFKQFFTYKKTEKFKATDFAALVLKELGITDGPADLPAQKAVVDSPVVAITEATPTTTGKVQATGFDAERFKKLAIKTAKRPEQTTIVLD